jgi:hypothetical protein
MVAAPQSKSRAIPGDYQTVQVVDSMGILLAYDDKLL